MSLDSNVKTIMELKKTFECNIESDIRINMEGMRYKKFQIQYQKFISYCGSSILGAQVLDVAPKNPLVRVFFGRQAGELANVDKTVTTLKEVIFGIDNEFKVADIDSTYINGVN